MIIFIDIYNVETYYDNLLSIDNKKLQHRRLTLIIARVNG